MKAADAAATVSWWGDARSGKLPLNMLGFGRALRRAGVAVDAERMALAQQSLMLVGLDKADAEAALESVLVSRQQDLAIFRELFEAYFRNPEVAQQLLSQLLPRSPEAAQQRHRPRVKEALSAIRCAQKQSPAKEELQLDAAMSASDRQRLQRADFNQLSASEYRLVQQLVRDIRLPLPSYRSRRTQLRPSGASVHWPASLKAAARTGGELASLRWRRRRKLPMPWLALVDVSGSMERYARLLLAFLHQASSPQRYPQLRRHVYSVGSSLRDLNSAFALSDPDAMLLRASSDIDDFGGGTRLGECLAQLRRQAGRHLVGRRTLVLLISDGLDTGEPQQLEQELQWIRRHSARLVWLNPLLRFEGYAPLAQGAGVLHRHSDAMLAVHNLESLQQLAIHLARLLQTPAASHG